MTDRQVPRVLRGGLTGRIYVVTRYRDLDGGSVEALEKYDVTDQFDATFHKDHERAVKAEAQVAAMQPVVDAADTWLSWQEDPHRALGNVAHYRLLAAARAHRQAVDDIAPSPALAPDGEDEDDILNTIRAVLLSPALGASAEETLLALRFLVRDPG